MFTTMGVAPFLGRYADRPNGPRYLMMSGALLAGTALILLAFMLQHLWQFYLLFGVVWGVAGTALGGVILGPTIVSKWFVRKRGRALAIATMGVSAGGVVAIPMATLFITAFGWRMAWAALGIVMLATIFPLGAFFMRRQPEDVGLLPDGDTPEEAARQAIRQAEGAGRPGLAVRRSFTVRQAFRSRAFWALVVVQTMTSMGLSPVLQHQVAYVQDKGFSLAQAAAIGTMVAFFAAAGKVPWGIIAERVPVRYVMAVAFILAGASLWLLLQAQSLSMLYAYSVLFGLTMGSNPPLSNLVWATYFGRDNLGSIRGYSTPLTRWTGGVSPVFAGLVYDIAGSYNMAFAVFSAAWVLAGAAVLMAGPPVEPHPAAGDPSEPRQEATMSEEVASRPGEGP
jgi:MFS family permease